MQFQASLRPAKDLDWLLAAWSDLEQRSAPSFFQSTHWIRCWLESLPSSIVPQVMEIRDGTDIVGLGVFVYRRVRRRKIFVVNEFHLTATGIPELDSVYVEYNGFLFDRNVTSSATTAALNFFKNDSRGWDEIHFPGITKKSKERLMRSAIELDHFAIEARNKHSYYINLNNIRRSGGSYIDNLSRNTRYQIRKALRQSESISEIRLDTAQNVDEALGYMIELAKYHQSYWESQGQRGAFSIAFFRDFHSSLIRSAFHDGHIQLIKISRSDDTVGYLYNFIMGGTVYAYQSGFNYDLDWLSKPGLVSHFLAINYNLETSASIYDFMAGYNQLKRSLSTHSGELTWLTLQRHCVKLRTERTLIELKDRMKVIAQFRRSPATEWSCL